MSVTAPPAAHSTAVRTHWSGAVLFAVAIVTSIAVWIRIVLPVVTLDSAATAPHNKHLFLVLWHAGGGTLMLFAGAAALYIGSTRRFFRGHKIFGYTYLIGGSLGAIAALTLIVSRAHYNVGINAATGTLAAVWLAVAAMAYRAVRNRRFDEHRRWMIRSYVLTWTFVFCRMVMATPSMAAAGTEAIAAVIWTTWVIPLLVCEFALQWNRAAER